MGSHYFHLKLDDPRKLAKWLEAKMPVSEIADRLGRDPSTIYRDIKRNRYTDNELPELNGYYALNAQDMYEKRRAVHRKMVVGCPASSGAKFTSRGCVGNALASSSRSTGPTIAGSRIGVIPAPCSSSSMMRPAR